MKKGRRANLQRQPEPSVLIALLIRQGNVFVKSINTFLTCLCTYLVHQFGRLLSCTTYMRGKTWIYQLIGDCLLVSLPFSISPPVSPRYSKAALVGRTIRNDKGWYDLSPLWSLNVDENLFFQPSFRRSS